MIGEYDGELKVVSEQVFSLPREECHAQVSGLTLRRSV